VARRTVADPHPHRSPDPPGRARALRVTSQTTDARPSHGAISLDPSPFRTDANRGPESAPKPSLNFLSFVFEFPILERSGGTARLFYRRGAEGVSGSFRRLK